IGEQHRRDAGHPRYRQVDAARDDDDRLTAGNNRESDNLQKDVSGTGARCESGDEQRGAAPGDEGQGEEDEQAPMPAQTRYSRDVHCALPAPIRLKAAWRSCADEIETMRSAPWNIWFHCGCRRKENVTPVR